MQVSLLNNRLPGVTGSPLSNTDARAKIFLSILASIMTIALANPFSQAILFIGSFFYALSMRRLKILLVVYAACCAILLLALGCAKIMSFILPLMPVTFSGLLVPFMRLGVMVNVVLPLAFTTPVQSIMTALKSMRLPFVIYIPMAVMVRYVPTFVTDCRHMYEALKIRGYTLSFRQFIRHPFLSLRFIVVPLIFRSLKTSEDLGMAAELKGLSTQRVPTVYKVSAWKQNDTLLVCAAVAVSVLAIACACVFQPEASVIAVKGVMR